MDDLNGRSRSTALSPGRSLLNIGYSFNSRRRISSKFCSTYSRRCSCETADSIYGLNSNGSLNAAG